MLGVFANSQHSGPSYPPQNKFHIMHEGSSQEVVVYEDDGDDAAPAYVIDSLPYFDALHEDYEQYALALVEEEMQRMIPPKASRLPPQKFKSPLLQNDYKTLSEQPDPPELDLEHRAMEPPPGSAVEAWRQAVREAKAEYEAERQRSTVLEIEKSDASTYQWKHYGTMLETIHMDGQARMMAEKEAVDRINAERQLHQEKEGRTLHLLALQFQGAVQKRFQLQAAVNDLAQAVLSSKGVQNAPSTSTDSVME